MVGVGVARVPTPSQLFEKNAQLLADKRNIKIPRMKTQPDHRLKTAPISPDQMPESG
jgi:hypothetical protein